MGIIGGFGLVISDGKVLDTGNLSKLSGHKWVRIGIFFSFLTCIRSFEIVEELVVVETSAFGLIIFIGGEFAEKC